MEGESFYKIRRAKWASGNEAEREGMEALLRTSVLTPQTPGDSEDVTAPTFSFNRL